VTGSRGHGAFSGCSIKYEYLIQHSTALTKIIVTYSVADPGSGAFLTPGSGIGLFRIPDPGSLTHIFESLVKGKKLYKSLKFGQNFFLQQFKNKIVLHFVKYETTKKCMTKIFFSPLFCSCFWIRDPRWVKIRIRDPE
jgi:hypothetical protein